MRLFSFVFLLALLVSSCKKTYLPVGLTNKIELEVITIDSITYSSAKITGRIGSGNAPVEVYGFCIDTLENNQSTRRSWDIKDNIFTLKITGLKPDSKYYLKAFLGFNNYTFYSKDTTFKTTPPTPPILDFLYYPYVSTNSIDLLAGIIDNGGATVTERGICWNTSGNPSLSDNVITLAGGEEHFYVLVNGLQVYSTYYLKSYAINKMGVSYSRQIKILTCGDGVKSGEGTVTDVQGNIYKTVKLGNQWWMAENFKCTLYSDGKTFIPLLSSETEWWNNPNESDGYSWYSNDKVTYNKYGILYNKFTVKNKLNLCPTGWHIPSVEAWDSLNIFLQPNTNSSDYISKFKSNEWAPASNTSGFSALPGGYRDPVGKFNELSETAVFMTSTPNKVFFLTTYYSVRNYDSNIPYFSIGASLRCIKN